MDAFALIRRRVSVRTYTGAVASEEARRALGEVAQGLTPPFGTRPRYVWLTLPEGAAAKALNLGTYGMIKGARTYLVGIVTPGPGVFEDFGYWMEQIILKATDLGLGTCWLGGTFDRVAFGAEAALGPGEIIAAITPVGEAADKPRLKESLMRAAIGAGARKPVGDLVFGEVGPWGPAVEAVRLGPSASNKQPWRLAPGPDGASVHFYLEETPGYNEGSIARCGFPIQTLDLGIAWCHWDLAVGALGLAGTWTRKDPALAVPPGWAYSATWTKRPETKA